MDDKHEEYIYDTLGDVLSHSSHHALLATIEAIASQLGVSNIQGMPIQEYYERTKVEIAEENIANLADMDMKCASEIKLAWSKVGTETEDKQEEEK